MSAHFPSSSSYASRSSSIVQGTSNFTASFWWRLTNTPTDNYVLFVQSDSPATSNWVAAIYGGQPSGLAIYMQITVNGSSTNSLTFTTTVNTWHHICIVRSGVTHNFYVDGVLIGFISTTVISGTLVFQGLGNDTVTSDSDTQEFYGYKEWATALTLTEILQEANSPTVVINTSNLHVLTLLHNNFTDTSGNSINWTSNGSPTFTSDPVFPTNLTPSTATALGSIPVSISDNAAPLSSFAFSLWYSYITVSSDNVLSVFPFGALGGYAPYASIYESDGVTLFINGDSSRPNVPMLFPSEGSGKTYYIQVAPSAQVTSASLTLKLTRHTDVTCPVGTLFINSDEDAFNGYDLPLAGLDVTNDNTVLAYINPFPVGEFSNILSNGTLAVSTNDESVNAAEIVIFNGSLARQTTIDFSANTSLVQGVSSDNVSNFYTFYLKSNSHWIIQQFSSTGVLGTTYDLGVIVGHLIKNLAINPANTIAYYQYNNDDSIRMWDLVNNVSLGVLVAPAGSHAFNCMICLTDGSIIIGNVTLNNVRRYNSSGTLLNTYTFAGITMTDADKLCTDQTSASFWYANKPSFEGLSATAFQVRCSDGTVLTKRVYAVFANQSTSYQTPTATPVNFGPSGSCAMWISRTSFSPVPVGTLVVGKASNPLATGVNFTITVSGQPPFVLQTDTAGQTLTLPPGNYSVIETANASWLPNYFVSNDPVNNNNLSVSIAANTLVDVVIENTLSAKYGGLYQQVISPFDTLRLQTGGTTQLTINWFYELYLNRDK